MILITGAAGKTGQSIIRALTAKRESIRALVHKNDQVQQLEDLGVDNVIVGDMRSQDVLSEVFHGIKAVYFICPNVHPEEYSIGQSVIRAAKEAGVEKFVYHSVFHLQLLGENKKNIYRGIDTNVRLVSVFSVVVQLFSCYCMNVKNCLMLYNNTIPYLDQ